MTHLIKLALLTAVALTPLSLNAQTADQIMARVEARDDGDNATSVMEMILIDKSGHQRKRSIRSFTKDKGPDTQRLMFFLEPADVRGTGGALWQPRCVTSTVTPSISIELHRSPLIILEAFESAGKIKIRFDY